MAFPPRKSLKELIKEQEETLTSTRSGELRVMPGTSSMKTSTALPPIRGSPLGRAAPVTSSVPSRKTAKNTTATTADIGAQKVSASSPSLAPKKQSDTKVEVSATKPSAANTSSPIVTQNTTISTKKTASTSKDLKDNVDQSLIPADLSDHCSKFLNDPNQSWKEISSGLKLLDRSYGENDEGDYDYYSKFELLFKGNSVWSAQAMRSSNIGGAWGSQMSASMSADKTTILTRLTNVNESIGSSKNTRGGEERVNVLQLLKKKNALTNDELAALEGASGATKTDANFTGHASERGSTWQLHNNPW